MLLAGKYSKIIILLVGVALVATTLFFLQKSGVIKSDAFLSASQILEKKRAITESVRTDFIRRESEAQDLDPREALGTAKAITVTMASINNTAKKEGRALTEKEITVLINLSDNRMQKLQDLARKDPRSFLLNAMSGTERASYPTEVQKNIEKETTIEAKVKVMHSDDFDNPNNSEFKYTLIPKNSTSQNAVELIPTKDINVISGVALKVRGFLLGKMMVAYSPGEDQGGGIQIIDMPEQTTDALGDQRTAFFIINSNEADPYPLSKAEISEQILNPDREGTLQHFYRDQSYGKVSFSGDFFGWIDIPSAGSSCNSPTDAEELKDYVVQNNIDLRNYQRIVFLFNNNSGCGNSSVGKWGAYLPLPDCTYADMPVSCANIGLDNYDGERRTPLGFVLRHEMGHSLGVWHANAWKCSDASIWGSDCYHEEYANYFDTMGQGLNSAGLNAFYRYFFNWLSPDDAINISESGTYSIEPLENSSGIRLAMVHNPLASTSSYEMTGDRYFLEQRRAVGYDSNLTTFPWYEENGFGLFVNTLWGAATQLLDMTPITTPRNFDDSPLVSGLEFSDLASGVSIGSISKDSANQKVNFTVTYGQLQCIASAPLVRSFYIPSVIAGGAISFTPEVINTTSSFCGDSAVELNLELPTGNSYKANSECPHSATLSPGESAYFCYEINIPDDIDPGYYNIPYTATDVTQNKSTQGSLSLQVKAPVVVDSIVPSS